MAPQEGEFHGQIAPIYLADAFVESGLIVLLLWTRRLA